MFHFKKGNFKTASSEPGALHGASLCCLIYDFQPLRPLLHQKSDCRSMRSMSKLRYKLQLSWGIL